MSHKMHYHFKHSIIAASLAAMVSGSAWAQYVSPTTPGLVQSGGSVTTYGGNTTIMDTAVVDVGVLPAGNPGKANGTGLYFGTLTQAQEADGSGSNLLVSGEGATVITGWSDGGLKTASLVVNGNAAIGTTITGGLSVAGSKINNVAAGTASTDAVNLGQMNAAIAASTPTSLDTGAGATISGNTVAATNGTFTNITGTLTGNVSGCVNDGSGGTVCGGTVAGTNGNFSTINSATINNTGALTQTGTSNLTGTTNINTTGSASTYVGHYGDAVDVKAGNIYLQTGAGSTSVYMDSGNISLNAGGGLAELQVVSGQVVMDGTTNINARNFDTATTTIGNANSATVIGGKLDSSNLQSVGTLRIIGNSDGISSGEGVIINSNGVGTNHASANNSSIQVMDTGVVTVTGNAMNFNVGGKDIVTIGGSGMTVHGNTTVYGTTTIVDTVATVNSLAVQGTTGTVFNVDAGTGALTSTGNATIATNDATANTFGSGSGSSNTIGSEGTSVNVITGMKNSMIATGTNSSNNISGTTNINVENGGTTNIGTAGASVTNIGDVGSKNTVLGTTSITGATTINTIGSLLTTLGNTSSTVQMLGGTNTIGNAGTSANTMTGNTNAITAATTNMITGGTGNTITASTGNNAMTASAGNNNITASAVNNIEAPTNNIGVATASSSNRIGNATSSNTIKGATSINDSINAATTINTGTSTGNVTMGNALNQTYLNSAYNEIGNSGTYATVNHVGDNSSNQSINTIGNGNVRSTVNSSGGASYTRLNQVDATMGTGTGGTVRTNATTATVQASLIGSTLASNGSTGQMFVGSGGGYTAYATSQNTGTGTIGNVVNNKLYTNKLSGNTFVDGNVYINGTLDYVSSNSANTSVIGVSSGTSILTNANQATSAGTAIVVKGATGTQTVVDANGKLTNVTGTAAQSTASLTLTNGIGNTHGLVVTETQASLSGGTQSSTLTMADNGGTFSDAQTGGPVQVHGVNDGTSDYDAVNVRQFASAVASVTAMANIPQVDQDKKVAMGMALGSFMGKTAVAAGVTYRFTKNGVLKGSVSSAMNSSNSTAVGVGAAWSY